MKTTLLSGGAAAGECAALAPLLATHARGRLASADARRAEPHLAEGGPDL